MVFHFRMLAILMLKPYLKESARYAGRTPKSGDSAMIVLGSLPLLQQKLIGAKFSNSMIRARVILIASDKVLIKIEKIVKQSN